MEVKNLEIGKRVEITVERESRLYHLTSDIVAIKDNIICVSLITGQYGEPFRFQNGDKVMLAYRRGEHLWQWKNLRAGLAKLGKEPIHALIASHSTGTSFNRRSVYRVAIGEEADIRERIPDLEAIREYRQAHPEIQDINELENVPTCYNMVILNGMVKDLSETGIGLYTTKELSENARLSVSLETECGKIDCLCTPVRSTIENDKKYKYFYGCQIISVGSDIAKVLSALQRRRLMLQRLGNRR